MIDKIFEGIPDTPAPFKAALAFLDLKDKQTTNLLGVSQAQLTKYKNGKAPIPKPQAFVIYELVRHRMSKKQ